MLDGTQPAVWTALRMNGGPQSICIAPSAPLIETYERGERTCVVVHGEVDIDVTAALHEALNAALDRSATGLDLELEPLRFCDCAGLRVLLQVRRAALQAGKTVHICSAGPPLARLLRITRTDTLFNAATATETATDHAPRERAMPTQLPVTPPPANSRARTAPSSSPHGQTAQAQSA
ncbi:STAS domain-containing protein [Streptomyces sp. NPDC050085]|uniref:STAS domain-containing protein n=1 Tax=Streptomyces sp. NPDC050085 TaxID=3365600 RepID=UPI0037A17FB6